MMIYVKHIPKGPGCYIYKNKGGNVIYVGKAKSLQKRVRSYFQKNIKDAKTRLLISEIASIDYFVTSNEVEALILENNLIKHYKPRFNIDLKDSRRYAYILVTEEDFPRIIIARDKKQKGKYFGPFVNAQQRDNIIKALRSAFGLRTCRRFHKRPCLRQHIKACSAPCSGAIAREEYTNRIHKVERYLGGDVVGLIKELTDEMNVYTKMELFEKSLILRNQIEALTTLYEKQKVERNISYDEDVINYVYEGDTVYLMLFNINKGVLATKHEFQFSYTQNFLEEFIVQYYAKNSVPKEILLPRKLKDDAIGLYLEGIRKKSVKLIVPKRGSKRELVQLVKYNIEEHFLEKARMLEELQSSLKLRGLPEVIECFDISHISGSYTVASMVQFRYGEADKSNYRRYKIKTVEGIDDYASIAEVVRRRYFRLKKESKILPDLIVIDGGKGQLMTAYEELRALGLYIPIISLAKRNEEVFVPGRSEPVKMTRLSKGLKLLIVIRDEAHRFAITYHKLVRKKGMLSDGL